jgi:hypothetical protein
MTMTEIYRLVETHASLTASDWEPQAAGSKGTRWKRNVRNVLQKRKSEVGGGGMFEWDRARRTYRLA